MKTFKDLVETYIAMKKGTLNEDKEIDKEIDLSKYKKLNPYWSENRLEYVIPLFDIRTEREKKSKKNIPYGYQGLSKDESFYFRKEGNKLVGSFGGNEYSFSGKTIKELLTKALNKFEKLVLGDLKLSQDNEEEKKHLEDNYLKNIERIRKILNTIND